MSSPSISQMEKQIEELKSQIALRKDELKREAKNKILDILREHGVSLEELFPQSSEPTAEKMDKRKGSVEVKYRDGDNTWTGRGKVPKWVLAIMEERGLTLAEFKVAPEFSVA